MGVSVARQRQLLGKLGDPRAVEPLISALKNPDSSVRGKAAGALVEIGEPAVAPLIGALRNPDGGISDSAMEALVRIGLPAVDSLISDLKAEDTAIRERASETLVRIGNPAFGPLIGAFEDSDTNVHREAASVLARTYGPRWLEPLFPALKQSNGDHESPAEPLVIAFVFHNNGSSGVPRCPVSIPISSFQRLPVKRVLCLFMPAK